MSDIEQRVAAALHDMIGGEFVVLDCREPGAVKMGNWQAARALQPRFIAALAAAGLAITEASEAEGLRALVSELAHEYHYTGSIRDHADPNDRTGWNVHGIETCNDPLCVEALAATKPDPAPSGEQEDR